MIQFIWEDNNNFNETEYEFYIYNESDTITLNLTSEDYISYPFLNYFGFLFNLNIFASIVNGDQNIFNWKIGIITENEIIFSDTFEFYYSQNLSNNNLNLITFKLHNPYPNPFNPTTSISFSIPEQSQTSLKVYGIKGNLISTLLNESINVGHHQIEWNASSYSSGVYFVKLDAGEFTQTQKLMLVK